MADGAQTAWTRTLFSQILRVFGEKVNKKMSEIFLRGAGSNNFPKNAPEKGGFKQCFTWNIHGARGFLFMVFVSLG